MHPTNVPFAGTPVVTGNVLTNDIFLDPNAVKAVTGVAVGAASSAGGNVGATLTGSYGTLVLGADGTYTYTLDPANAAGIALAQGQQAFDVFTYTMNDSLGHFSTATLTIDVIGTDDQPVIAPADKVETASSPIVENALVTGDATPHAENGTIHFTDVDLTDRPTATVSAQTVTYTASFGDEGHTTLTLAPAQLAAIEQAFTVAPEPGSTSNGTIDWTYSVADSALDFLAVNETVTLVSTVQVDDHNGGTDTATVTLTINGSNDLPIVTHVDNGAVTKDALPVMTPSEIVNGGFEDNGPAVRSSIHFLVQPFQQTASGTIGFSDADLSDTHSVTNIAFVSTDLDGGTGPHIGGMTANLAAGHDTTGTGLNGIVDWTVRRQ